MAEKQIDSSSANTLLKQVHVAAPCLESWDAMPGGDKVRSCDRCQHRVYNLSEMTATEAEALLRQTEGRLCVRFYRRADGTIMTKDCPVGLKAVRQRFVGAATAVAASVAFACSATVFNRPRAEQPRWIQWAMNALAPEPVTVGEIVRQPVELPMYQPTMGMYPEPIMGTPAPIATPEPVEPVMGEPVMGNIARPEMGKVVAEPIDARPIMGAVAPMRESPRKK